MDLGGSWYRPLEKGSGRSPNPLDFHLDLAFETSEAGRFMAEIQSFALAVFGDFGCSSFKPLAFAKQFDHFESSAGCLPQLAGTPSGFTAGNLDHLFPLRSEK